MSSNGQPLIQARNLVKRFDDFVAVDGIDLERPCEAVVAERLQRRLAPPGA